MNVFIWAWIWISGATVRPGEAAMTNMACDGNYGSF